MTPRIEILDLGYQGSPGQIASFLIFGPDGHALVECGPFSCHASLESGLAAHGLVPGDVDYLFLTHIHLDHAGAAGWWAQQGTTVCVHEVGAPHLTDPTRLIRSATRIYGDQMETLWGEIRPAPAENVRAVADGEVIRAIGLEFRALHTPGHANHHHAWRLGDLAFVGDSMGIRGGPVTWLDLPAPPPEFDRELWLATLDKLRGENLDTIYRTHFGPRVDVARELDRVGDLIEASVGRVEELLAEGLEHDELIERYSDWMRGKALADGADPEAVGEQKLNPRQMSVDGIVRYLRKRALD